MSHLGEVLSALIDGELSGAELDRANAHVAACGACRVEANALRRLKLELRALGEVHNADGITTRLLAMTSESSGTPCEDFLPLTCGISSMISSMPTLSTKRVSGMKPASALRKGLLPPGGAINSEFGAARRQANEL